MAFEYSALDSIEPQIRLLQFKSCDATSLEFSIQHHNLADKPQYVALSYTWGPETPTSFITIDSTRVEVRQNLFQFLETWSSHFRGTYLWIDQICINQADIRERNMQVAMMDRIYRDAAEVATWLGMASDGSDLLIDQIALWHGSHSGKILLACDCAACMVMNELLRDDSGALLRSYTSLSTRLYWSRVWIIQELILAHSVKLLCGQKAIPLQALYSFYFLVDGDGRDDDNIDEDEIDKGESDESESDKSESDKDIDDESEGFPDRGNKTFRDLMDMKFTMEINNHAETKSWYDLGFREDVFDSVDDLLTYLDNMAVWKCHVDADKIYALRGLLPESARVEVDYNKSLYEVLLDVLRVECRCSKGSVRKFALELGQQMGVKMKWKDVFKIEEEELGSGYDFLNRESMSDPYREPDKPHHVLLKMGITQRSGNRETEGAGTSIGL
jgi:hypothetical protein